MARRQNCGRADHIAPNGLLMETIKILVLAVHKQIEESTIANQADNCTTHE
jgi:hypothetical protein